MDRLEARVAEEFARARARVARIRAALPAMAADLQARGATRIVLIGSIARGDEPHEDTDVDLVVWGLGMGAAYEAACELGARISAPVEVIPAELAGARLLRAVAREGIELLRAPGATAERGADVAG